jgi:hypothetical protein
MKKCGLSARDVTKSTRLSGNYVSPTNRSCSLNWQSRKPATPQIKSLLRRSASKPRADQHLTEEQAAERFPTDIYLAKFTPMRHTLTGRHARTVMKLVVEQSSQKIVGAHMLGDDAPEMMQGIAVAITAGATKADFDQTVGNSSHRGGGVGHDADPDPCCGCGGESGGMMTPLGPAMRGHFDV